MRDSRKRGRAAGKKGTLRLLVEDPAVESVDVGALCTGFEDIRKAFADALGVLESRFAHLRPLSDLQPSPGGAVRMAACQSDGARCVAGRRGARRARWWK